MQQFTQDQIKLWLTALNYVDDPRCSFLFSPDDDDFARSMQWKLKHFGIHTRLIPTEVTQLEDITKRVLSAIENERI